MSDSNIDKVADLAKRLEVQSGCLQNLLEDAVNPGLSPDNYVSKTW